MTENLDINLLKQFLFKMLNINRVQVLKLAKRVADNFISRNIIGSDDYGNNYEVELAYEALINLDINTDSVYRYLKSETMDNPNTAKSWKYQLFHDVAYPWFESINKLEEFKEAYVSETNNWIEEAVRRESGTIVYYGPQEKLGSLIDMLQAYMIRLFRTANFTNDKKYAEEAVNQYRLYRKELRNVDSGCFHQGKGWLEGDVISPSTWSRGQGWVLHGLVQSIPLSTQWKDLQDELKGYYKEVLLDLLKFQTNDGFWNMLVDSPEESLPDTSGTGLILEAMVLGLKHGYVKGGVYEQSCNNAWEALAGEVDEDGVIDQVSKGPGTIWEVGPWRNTRGTKGEPHGIFSFLFACSALLE